MVTMPLSLYLALCLLPRTCNMRVPSLLPLFLLQFLALNDTSASTTSLRASGDLDDDERTNVPPHVTNMFKLSVPSTLDASVDLEHMLAQKVQALEAFERLGLDRAGTALVQDPNFLRWVQYVELFNKHHPEHAEPMITTLTSRFPPRELIQLLEQAKTIKATEHVATLAQRELVQHLVELATPQKIVTLLSLDSIEALFEPPFLSFLTACVDAYNAKHPTTKDHGTVDWLVMQFGVERAWRMLYEAKAGANEKVAAIARAMEAQQQETWRQKNWFVRRVFEDLRLDAVPVDGSTNPRLEAWLSYVNSCVEKHLDSMPEIFSFIERAFSPKQLLHVLEVAETFPSLRDVATDYRIYKRVGLPKKAFKEIGLADNHETVLANPHFKTWFMYALNYMETHPSANWFMAIASWYKLKEIAQMIVRASNDRRTVLTADRVRHEFFNFLLRKFQHPDLVFDYFQPSIDDGRTLILEKVRWWLKYRTRYNLQLQGTTHNQVGADKLKAFIKELRKDATNEASVRDLEALV
ncbi:hypothetical protein PsorP6_012578 [Peronosclerospora sorghi]|uniref:Uncharacterized protein n=1 Tax=Peronosclerospora sorghi TaxID=230839 RepID=A0ACC0WFY2_9STRA|nr:hypothetical protein PsorP6_012578 [Peronosclerospora sorghi]